AVLYAVAAVASASVLGAVAEQVILPAIMEQRTTVAAVATASAVVFAVGFLKALGLGARRFYAGLMQYRMQARYRRAVARRYLELPLAWHQRHPAGQLLSNANADVEATLQPTAPLPRGPRAVPRAGALPERGHPPVPGAPAGLAPAAPRRAAPVQRQRRR